MQAFLVDFVLDIAQNSIEAEAEEVYVLIDEKEGGTVRFLVRDNGCGMDEETLGRVQDPFFTNGIKHKARKAGLGIPFVIQATEAAGGAFGIVSEKGKGTEVSFSFDEGNIDCPPMGDIPSLSLSLMSHPGAKELVFERNLEDRDGRKAGYTARRSELLDVLGDLTDAGSLGLLREYLMGLEDGLFDL